MSKELRKHPFVLLNVAITADGKIATANRAITSFSSDRDQVHLYELRASVGAVLCGAGTVNVRGVTLGTGGARYLKMRRSRGLTDDPLRVVVSGRGTLAPDADVFNEGGGPLIVIVSETAPKTRVERLRRSGAEVWRMGGKDVDLAQAMAALHSKHGVDRIVCEGGAELNDAMFRAGLIDEVHLTWCPKLFGGRAAPTLAEGIGVPRLTAATRLELQSSRRAGDELFLVYRVLHP